MIKPIGNKQREEYPRDQHSTILSSKGVGPEVIPRTPREGSYSLKSLRGRVTRHPTQKSAGKADHVVEQILEGAFGKRVAPQLKKR